MPTRRARPENVHLNALGQYLLMAFAAAVGIWLGWGAVVAAVVAAAWHGGRYWWKRRHGRA